MAGAMSKDFHGEEWLLRGVAADVALRQRLFQSVNLSLGEVGVVLEKQILQLRKLSEPLHISQSIISEIQIR